MRHFLVLLIVVALCGCKDDQAAVHLAWSQSAPTRSVLDHYSYALYTDGNRIMLSGTTCDGTGPDYDCMAPLPPLTTGAHILELATVDTTSGLESARSQSVTYDPASGAGAQSATGSLRVLSSAAPGARVADAVPVPTPERVTAPSAATIERPARVCTSGAVPRCFDVSLVADDIRAVERVVALPDGRVLLTYSGAIVWILPDGVPQRLDLGRSTASSEIGDIAVDPDFGGNQFVYVAAVTTADDGRRIGNVVRMREVSGGLAEAATIAAGLPAVHGPPAISIGPDRRIYVALSSGDDGAASDDPYEGVVLRLGRDGAAAGSMNSPVLATGTSHPASMAWIDPARLLVTSNRPGDAVIGLISVQGDDAAGSPIIPLLSAGRDPLSSGVKQLSAIQSTARTFSGSLFALGVSPQALYALRLSTDSRPHVMSIDEVPLGGLRPEAFAIAPNADLLVAAREPAAASMQLLRLHAR